MPFRQIRERMKDLEEQFDRRPTDAQNHDGVMLAKVIADATMTDAAGGTYVGVHPVKISGPQIEGSPATFTVLDQTVSVLFIGKQLVKADDIVICKQAGNVWVVEPERWCAGDITGEVSLCNPSLLPDAHVVSGVTVTLTDSMSDVIGTTTTDSSGLFSFPDVQDGIYTITAEGPCGDGTVSVTAKCGVFARVNVPGATITFVVNYECGLAAMVGVIESEGLPVPILVVTGPDGFRAEFDIDPNGHTLCVPPNATYTFTWQAEACWQTPTPQTQLVECAATITFDVNAQTYDYQIQARGCSGVVLPGATVAITGISDPMFFSSSTSDAVGLSVPVALKATCQYSVTVSKAHFVSQTHAINMPCFAMTGGLVDRLSLVTPPGFSYIGLAPEAGWHCDGGFDPPAEPDPD